MVKEEECGEKRYRDGAADARDMPSSPGIPTGVRSVGKGLSRPIREPSTTHGRGLQRGKHAVQPSTRPRGRGCGMAREQLERRCHGYSGAALTGKFEAVDRYDRGARVGSCNLLNR